MWKIVTVNVNGIRAAMRKGMGQWLEENRPDVLLLQEVRAPIEILSELLGPDWLIHAYPSLQKGRAGVAVAVLKGGAALPSGRDDVAVEVHATGLQSEEEPVDSGRWLEVNITPGITHKPLRLVSAYFHAGEFGTIKQEAKMAHLAQLDARICELWDECAQEYDIIIGGDFNVVRGEQDITNWKQNHNKSAGVLDEEITYLQRWFSAGWIDVSREYFLDRPGPYTWWSWRGQAFTNDVGWRIDYQMCTPELGNTVQTVEVHRAADWDSRFTDHAPVVAVYAATD